MSLLIHSHYTCHKISPLQYLSPSFKPAFRRLNRAVRMDSSSEKDKVIVIMGATGSGKSKLSVDLANRFEYSEIINSDKMQVYSGLDLTTNKISIQERLGVPHHFLGVFDPEDGEVTPSEFRLTAGLAISDIVSRQKLPFVVGGSNSFIHALLVDRFNPEINVFDGSLENPVPTQLRYDCCLLWVDVSLSVLCDYLCKRVDEMLDSGMFEELSEYFRSENLASQPGLRKAIGVPEFDRYFKKYPPGTGGGGEWDSVRRGAYEEAVREIKDNTCQLAKRQLWKIMRLKRAGWDLKRVDATEAFKVAMEVAPPPPLDNKKKKKRKKKKRWIEVWERDVLEPSMKIVNRFLEE